MRSPALASLLLTLLVPSSALAGGAVQPGASPAHWRTVLGGPDTQDLTGLAIDRRGNPRTPKWVYVADSFVQRIVKFGTGGKRLGSWAYAPETRDKPAVGVAVGGSGNVFVTEPVSGTVSKFTAGGTRLAGWTGLTTPVDVAVDRTGRIYVAERFAERVTVLSPAGKVMARWPVHWGTGAGQAAPNGVALASDGSVYVAATCFQIACTAGHGDQQDEVIHFNPSGVPQSIRIGSTPHGGVVREQEAWLSVNSIATDRQGHWYVAGAQRLFGPHMYPGTTIAEALLEYGSTGNVMGQWRLPSISEPLGLAVDNRGTVYVSQRSAVYALVR